MKQRDDSENGIWSVAAAAQLPTTAKMARACGGPAAEAASPNVVKRFETNICERGP
jgi:hypothetical protein